MIPIDQVYRARLRLLCLEYKTQAALAAAIGKAPAQISQWINALPDSKTGKPRAMDRETARLIEERLGLRAGSMDQPLTADEKGRLEAGTAAGAKKMRRAGASAASGAGGVVVPSLAGGIATEIAAPSTFEDILATVKRFAALLDAMPDDERAAALPAFETLIKAPDSERAQRATAAIFQNSTRTAASESGEFGEPTDQRKAS